MYSQRAGPLNVLDRGECGSRPCRSRSAYAPQDRATLRSFITPSGNGALVRSSGIRRVEELDWWQEAKTSALPSAADPSYSTSLRGVRSIEPALWRGFMLVADGAHIFFDGDTAHAPFFHDVRQRLGPIDLALPPISAYEPPWFMKPVHMNPAEAVQAHLDLEAS